MFNKHIRNWWLWTIKKLSEERGDIGQMITPPKSKSPWEAATSGSTGGWASFAGPSTTQNPDDPAGSGRVGPLLTTAMGAIPGIGPGLSAGMGALGAMGGGTGFQGTDKGWGNIGSTALGAIGGYGLGTIGKGIGSGLSAAMSPTATVGTGSGSFSMLNAAGTGPATGMEAFGGGFATGVSQALQPFAGLLGGGDAAATGTKDAGDTGLLKAAKDKLTSPLTLMGAGLAAVSSMITTPQPPQVGDVVSKWLTSDAVTKAGKIAQGIQETEYMGDFELDAETQAYMEVMGKDIEKNYKDRVVQLDKNMTAYNTNWKFSGERLEMVRRINEEGQREQDMMRSQWIQFAKQTYSQNKYNTVMSSMKVDESVKQDLLFGELADIMWKYNVERDDVLNFREIARDAGMYMLQQGISGGDTTNA